MSLITLVKTVGAPRRSIRESTSDDVVGLFWQCIRYYYTTKTDYYTTKTFSISMSIDSSTDNFGPQVPGTLAVQESSLQEVSVGLTGRYLKFQVLTYGLYSAALKYVAVLV